MKPLSMLEVGETAAVASVRDMGRGIGGRLGDLGFTKGTAVRCTMRSLLGDPTAYLVRGTVICLRREDAAAILTDAEGLS